MLRKLTPEEVSLEVLSGPDEVARGRLVFADGHVSVELTGCVLEACYAWREGHLVLLTQDVMYEETLMIYLLDGKGEVLDRAKLKAHTAAFVDDLREEGENSIFFSFLHADEWEVRLYESPRWCWPRVDWLERGKRFFQFRQYFDLIMRIPPGGNKDAA